MSELLVTFKHSIGDRVTIVSLDNAIGIVETMSVSVLGRDYRVAYWHEGRRYSEWLREDEILPI